MSEFLDFSGYGSGFTYETGDAGTEHNRLATAAGVEGFAVRTSNADLLVGENPLFSLSGVLPDNYTYEAWVKVIGTGFAEQQIFGISDDAYIEGIAINGTVVSFKVMYATADDSVLTFDTKYLQRLHIVATHSKYKNELWINGELVTWEDTTEEQQADTLYEHEAATAKLGYSLTDDSTPVQILTLNAVAAYAAVLTPEQIARHWGMGTNYHSADAIVNNWGGEKFDLFATGNEVFLDETWRELDEWNIGQMNGIRFEDGELRPEISAGVSLGGTWTRAVYLANSGEDPLAGINFDWDGDGVVVEVSLDGDTWEEVEESVNIDLIPYGFDPTDVSLYVRVTFTDGVTDDSQYLDNLHIVGYRAASREVYGRTLTIEGTRLRDFHPMDQHEQWGTRLDTGEEITISATTEDDSELHAVEMWVTDVDGDFPTTNLHTPADIITVQGEEVTPKADVLARMEPGAWYQVVYLLDDDFTGDVTVTGPGQVGHIAFYAAPFTDGTQYQRQYFEYTGDISVRYTDTSAIEVDEFEDGTLFYAEDWTILAS